MIKYNFNISPRCGKTYYEMNVSWRDLKTEVKRILDDRNSCRKNKIDLIICRLEHYKKTYLTSRGEKDV